MVNSLALESWHEVLGGDLVPQVLVVSSSSSSPDHYYFIKHRQQQALIAYQYVGSKVLGSFLRTLKKGEAEDTRTPLESWIHFRLSNGEWESLQLHRVAPDGKVMMVKQEEGLLLSDSFALRIKKEAPHLLQSLVANEKTTDSPEEIQHGFSVIEGEAISSTGLYEKAFEAWPEERRDLSEVDEFKSEDFDIEQEALRIYVPKTYQGDEAYGMLIFISAGTGLPQFSSEWQAVFEAKKIIWATAKDIGNKTPVGRRFRLPRLARNYVGRHYNIDPQRVYLSGFSGGGRMSSGMLANYPGSFTGTIHFCGISALAKEIPHYSKANTVIYGWSPVSGALSSAKKNHHFALVTGPKDFNYDDTKNVFNWLEENHIKAHLIEVPDLAHQVPKGVGPISEAIDFLDQPRKSVKIKKASIEQNQLWARELDQLTRLSVAQVSKARVLAAKMWDRHEEIRNNESFVVLLEKLEQWPEK